MLDSLHSAGIIMGCLKNGVLAECICLVHAGTARHCGVVSAERPFTAAHLFSAAQAQVLQGALSTLAHRYSITV